MIGRNKEKWKKEIETKNYKENRRKFKSIMIMQNKEKLIFILCVRER